MIAVYGNSGFWAWLRYWYLDSADFVTLMLIDKGYYDYDYSDPYDERKERMKALKPKSNAEVQEKLSRMGFGNIMAKEEPPQQFTPEEMQRIAMAEARERKNKQ